MVLAGGLGAGWPLRTLRFGVKRKSKRVDRVTVGAPLLLQSAPFTFSVFIETRTQRECFLLSRADVPGHLAEVSALVFRPLKHWAWVNEVLAFVFRNQRRNGQIYGGLLRQ